VRGFGKYAIWVYSAMALVFLMVPIIYTIVFSFNDSRRTNIVWRGFTFDNWLNVCSAQGVCQAFANSILIGVVATVLATTLGTISRSPSSATGSASARRRRSPTAHREAETAKAHRG